MRFEGLAQHGQLSDRGSAGTPCAGGLAQALDGLDLLRAAAPDAAQGIDAGVVLAVATAMGGGQEGLTWSAR